MPKIAKTPGVRLPRKTSEQLSEFIKACDLWDRGKLVEAHGAFLKLAKRGDLGAQVNLATFHADGLARPRDLTQAKFWLRKAIRGGAGHAATNLALVLWSERDVKGAERYFKRGAKLGDGDAWLQLARFYLFENADADRAEKALRRAIANESAGPHTKAVAEAMLRLGGAYR
jgi:TPR repeat protein